MRYYGMLKLISIIFLVLISFVALAQGDFKISYPYNISSIEIEDEKLNIQEGLGFTKFDSSLNVVESKITQQLSPPYCTYMPNGFQMQSWKQKWNKNEVFSVTSSFCAPTTAPGYYNRINIGKVNYSDSSRIVYSLYMPNVGSGSLEISNNRIGLLSRFNLQSNFVVLNHHLIAKWGIDSLSYYSNPFLYDSLNFAISINDSVFCVLDSSANVLYKKKHTPLIANAIKNISPTKNIICGQVNQNKGIIVTVTDQNFNPLWSKQIYTSDSTKNTIADLFVADNEEIYITTNKQDSTSYILKLDNQGNLVSHKKVTGLGQKTKIGAIKQFGQKIVTHYLLYNTTSVNENIVLGLSTDLSSSCASLISEPIIISNKNFIIQNDTSATLINYFTNNTTNTSTVTFVNPLPVSIECNSVGLSEIQNQIQFNVYPNPLNEKVNIECNQNFDRIVIKNIIGEEVHKSIMENETNKATIENLDLKEGFYLVIAYKDQKIVATKKVIVNNK